MKLILLISVCQLTFFACFCQESTAVSDLPEIKTTMIKLETSNIKPLMVSHIAALTIIDCRRDTTSFGFYKSLSGKNYSIVTSTNAANEIATFMKDYLQVNGNKYADNAHVVMCIKKLWLTNELAEDTGKNFTKNAAVSWLSGVMAKVEFYRSYGSSYIPLYRFDTAYAVTKNIRDFAREYINNVLMLSVQKLARIDLNGVPVSRKRMSLEEVNNFSKQQLTTSIITAQAYKKGVYKSFEEFTFNNPAFTSYEIRKDQYSDMIFVKDGSGEHPVRDVWGFCDGTHLFIKSAENYFELHKKQQTFIVEGVKTLSRNRHIKAGNILMLGFFAGAIGKGNKKISYNMHLKLYQLDMDEGQLY